jgi:hypothetical protein
VFYVSQEWIHAIEKVLGVGEESVSLSDFDCLTLVGKGAYGKYDMPIPPFPHVFFLSAFPLRFSLSFSFEIQNTSMRASPINSSAMQCKTSHFSIPSCRSSHKIVFN